MIVERERKKKDQKLNFNLNPIQNLMIRRKK